MPLRWRLRVRDRLRKLYYSIGIHGAPPGTLFFYLHTRLRKWVHRRLYRYASGDLFARAAFGGRPYYDIQRVRSTRQIDGFALIFFMGIGDYLFATPTIEALRLAYPGMLLYAYASTNADAVNSPVLADMLRANRFIDAVFTYQGKPGRTWIEYDFRVCLKDIPKSFLILPVIYDTNEAVFHRVSSLLETFRLPVRLPLPVPVLDITEPSAAASRILSDIRHCVARNSPPAVVFCHFGTRSSAYLYPHRDDLVRALARAGYVVVTFSQSDVSDSRVIGIDAGRITPNDTIGILRSIKDDGRNVYIISVNSVMWPISAGLGITNLGLHIFHDMSIHQYIYPNLFVVTQHFYTRLSPSRLFLAPNGRYAERPSSTGTILTDYNADYILECFSRMVDQV